MGTLLVGLALLAAAETPATIAQPQTAPSILSLPSTSPSAISAPACPPVSRSLEIEPLGHLSISTRFRFEPTQPRQPAWTPKYSRAFEAETQPSTRSLAIATCRRPFASCRPARSRRLLRA